jgi:serine/threonine-protein kinase HipA
MAAALNVWMNGELVGVWSSTRAGVPSFTYEPAWVRSPHARALSLSLPITAAGAIRGEVVESYFDNLLPDSADIRKRLTSRFKAKSTHAFDLLTAIGRDCVGAVQLLPPSLEPVGWNRIHSEPLTEEAVERILLSVTSPSVLGHDVDDDDGFRISLAGAQEKTALLKIGGRWHRPHGATPTTHILKLPLGLVGNVRADMTASVENEWLSAQIVRELGLPVADCEIVTFGQQKVLAVKRFDRRWQGVDRDAEKARRFVPPDDAWIARLPQEDFCQATGLPPTKKYEVDGGPSMSACLDVLAGSERADVDRAHFALAQLAFWLLAGIDGHAKNFSIAHRRGGAYALTPLYDVLSAWPIMGNGANLISPHRAKMAMALRGKNAHYRLKEIHARHWKSLAASTGVEGLWEQMNLMVASTDAALSRVHDRLPRGFPEPVWTQVAQGMKTHAARFMSESAELVEAQ